MMAAIMLFLMNAQHNGSSIYHDAFMKSAEAQYVHSDLQTYVESAGNKAKEKAPAVAAIGVPLYAIGVQHRFKATSIPLKALSPNVTLAVNATKTDGSIGITWHF